MLLVVLPAAAEGISTRYFSNTTVAAPGETTSIGQLQITAENTTLTGVEASINLPFNYSITPETKGQLSNDTSYNASVSVSPPWYRQPGNFSRNVTVESANYTSKQAIEFEVSRVNNWTVNTSSVSRSYSIGSSGTLTTLTVSQNGNVPDEIDAKVTGGIADVLQIQPSFQILPKIPKTLAVVYDIPKDHKTGNFSGTIVFNSSEVERKVNISLELRDDTRPEILLTEFPDVEATQSTEFKLKARDNLKIKKVTGKVYRDPESANASREKISEFFFKHKDGEVYSHNFKGLSEEGNYSVEATVYDTAGNNVTVTGEFQVLPLDVIRLWNYNFNIGKVVQGQERNRTVLKLEDKADVSLAWHKVVPEETEGEIEVGLMHESWSEPKYFDKLGHSIKLKKAGNYSVVVTTEYGRNVTDFNVELALTTPEKHVEEPDIIFGGQAIQNFAEPGPFAVNGLHGRTYYSEFRDGVPAKKALTVEGDARDCKGKQRMTQCIPGLNLGKIENLTQENSQLQSKLNSKVGLRNFVIAGLFFSVIVVWWGGRQIRRNAGRLRTQRMIQYNNTATSQFFDDEEQETPSKSESSNLKIFDN